MTIFPQTHRKTGFLCSIWICLLPCQHFRILSIWCQILQRKRSLSCTCYILPFPGWRLQQPCSSCENPHGHQTYPYWSVFSRSYRMPLKGSSSVCCPLPSPASGLRSSGIFRFSAHCTSLAAWPEDAASRRPLSHSNPRPIPLIRRTLRPLCRNFLRKQHILQLGLKQQVFL